MKKRHSGNTFIGLIIGLVLGLGVALGIAVYVTKVPIPFTTKTQRNGPEQDEAEARKNRDWDPNAPLAGKAGAARAPAAAGSVTAAPQPATVGPLNPPATAPAPPVPVVVAPSARSDSTAASPAPAARAARTAPAPAEANATPSSGDPLGDFAKARGLESGVAAAANDPFVYFVQAGAYRTPEDAEAQRAKLSLMGVEARVTEREQAGRTVYRVRAGPFNKKDDADRLKERLDRGSLESTLVRVQR